MLDGGELTIAVAVQVVGSEAQRVIECILQGHICLIATRKTSGSHQARIVERVGKVMNRASGEQNVRANQIGEVVRTRRRKVERCDRCFQLASRSTGDIVVILPDDFSLLDCYLSS